MAPMLPRYLRGYGLIEAPLAGCVAQLDGAQLGERSVLHHRTDPFSRDAAAAYLSHLTWPATRWALFAVNDRWTAVVNNARNGSDFVDNTFLVARLCSARTCRVVDEDSARIFELLDTDGTTVRTIHAVRDGDRWSFGTHGEPIPVEAAFDYTARRIRDRFEQADAATSSRD